MSVWQDSPADLPGYLDLEPPKGLAFGLGLGLGLGPGWSGPTCNVEINHARRFVPACT